MGGVMVLAVAAVVLARHGGDRGFRRQLGWLPSHGATIRPGHHHGRPRAAACAAAGGDAYPRLPACRLPGGAGRAEDALGAGYVALARSHGAGPLRVLVRQAAPNAALPLVNQFAISFGGLLGGTVLVETVFAYPGLGSLLYEGILAHDLPLVQGVFLLLVFSVVLANAAADLVEAALDPRLRRRREANR